MLADSDFFGPPQEVQTSKRVFLTDMETSTHQGFQAWTLDRFFNGPSGLATCLQGKHKSQGTKHGDLHIFRISMEVGDQGGIPEICRKDSQRPTGSPWRSRRHRVKKQALKTCYSSCTMLHPSPCLPPLPGSPFSPSSRARGAGSAKASCRRPPGADRGVLPSAPPGPTVG